MGYRCIAAPILFAAAVALVAGDAAALFGSSKRRCDPTDNDIAAANMVIAEVEQMERAVIEALRLQTGQLAGYEAQGALAVTRALDSQTRLQAQVAREIEESETIRAHAPTASACRTVTGAAGLAAGRTGEARAGVAAEAIETGRIVQDLAVVAPGGGLADSDARFRVLTGTFCAQARAGQEACSGEERRHAADVMPGSLFDKPTLQSREERQAAVELARNLAAPVVGDPLPYGTANTPAERRRALLARSADARTALAAAYFSVARALREPAVDLAGWAAALLPGDAPSSEAALSRYELLEVLASRRFDDPGWFVELEAMNAEALLREHARLAAVALILDWERFRLDERRGAIEAARLAIATEETRARSGLANPSAGVN